MFHAHAHDEKWCFLKLERGGDKVTGLLYWFISSDVLVFVIQRKLKIFYQNVLHNYLSVMSEAVLEVFLERVHSALSYTMSLVDHILVILMHVYFLVLAVVQQVHTVKYRHIFVTVIGMLFQNLPSVLISFSEG